jgi:hypothetical protein
MVCLALLYGVTTMTLSRKAPVRESGKRGVSYAFSFNLAYT